MNDQAVTPLIDDPRIEIGAVTLGDEPSGHDLRDEAIYDELDTEFRKMESGGPTAVDWGMINQKTLEVLKTQSKDLILASRMAFGLFRTEGYLGMAVGLAILKGMVEDHWEGLFPPARRERGRASAMDWLAERLGAAVEAAPPEASDGKAVVAAYDTLESLDDLLSAKLERFTVALGPLIRALRPYAQEARRALEESAKAAEAAAAPPEPAPQPESVPAEAADTTAAEPREAEDQPAPVEQAPVQQAVPAAQAAPPAPQPATPSAPVAAPAIEVDVSVDEGADKSFHAIFGAARRVATAVRSQAPADPRTYLCARFAAWGAIAMLPPETAGKTALPPPQRGTIDELGALRNAGNHMGLVNSAENAFLTAPFWLDLHYIVDQALDQLGPQYEDARATVRGQLSAFVDRLPGIEDLSFSDGRPFADDETRNWIASEVRSSGGEGAALSELDIVKSEAGKLGQSGKVLDGLAVLTRHAETRFGERDRFLAHLQIGDYCLRYELLKPLFALLDTLATIADKRALSEWEPELAVSLASLTWRALAHQNARHHVSEEENLMRRGQIMTTLSELDIVVAAKLSAQ